MRYGVDTFYGPDPSTKLETHLMNVQQTSMWNVFGGLIHKKKFHQVLLHSQPGPRGGECARSSVRPCGVGVGAERGRDGEHATLQTYVFFIEKLLFILSHAIVVKFLIRHKDRCRFAHD